jgi:hypothetical protein
MIIYKRIVEKKVKIGKLFYDLGIENKENSICEIKFPLKIKTPYGFKKIVTAFRTEKQKVVTTYFKNNKTLKTSENHLLKVNGEWKKIKDITLLDVVETETGTTSIKRKHIGKEEVLYDVSVEDVHCYYSNGIVSHNSWLLSRIGAEAMKNGKNVVHFTLELNENYVGLRYDSCFTGVDFQDIRNNIDVVKKRIEEIPGRLFIKYFPIKTIASHTLKMHVERIEMLIGVKIDLIIVDYADLLRPAMTDKNANSYSEAGSVYEELRSVAGELQVPIWSASQAHRGAHEANTIQAHNVADSYRKIMTGDFVISLSRKMGDKQSSTARIHVIKNRFGADGMTFPTFFNSCNGDIKVYDPASPEGVELLQKMKDSEDTSKDAMREQWNQMKKNKGFTDD